MKNLSETIVCTPCLAFEALGTLIFSQHYPDSIPNAKEYVSKNLTGLKNINPSNSYFDLLTSHHSLKEIEKLDVDKLCELYTEYVHFSGYSDGCKSDILHGIDIIKSSSFTDIYKKHILPVLEKGCQSFINSLDHEKITGILSDVLKVHQKDHIDCIRVYMTHFSQGISFLLTENSYLTYCEKSGSFNTGFLMRLLAHELSHRFSNGKARTVYAGVTKTDKFFHRTNWFLSNYIGSPGDEEEFVQAIDRIILVRNGLATYDSVIEDFKTNYKCAVPIAVILFNALYKLDNLPEDMNEWIFKVFTDGTINVFDIKSQVNSIIPGYSDSFDKYWEEAKTNKPEYINKYLL